MDIRTMQKLERLGFDKDWLTIIKYEWKPKKRGQYDMLITDIKNLSDDPLYGERIERTKFDNDYDLSLIHMYFEGNAYVIVDCDTNKIISKGIIDYSIFDVMHDYTQEHWDMFSKEELKRERLLKAERKTNLINRIMRENTELQLEIAKLRLQLKER